MTNPPPVVTLAVPMLGWYDVTTGNVQVSSFLSVPNASFLSSPDGVNAGLVGTNDGAMIHLAGTATTGDGGQNWFMWAANSMAVANGLTIFNPYPSASTPGRWLAQLVAPPQTSKLVVSGAVIQLQAATIYVKVSKTVPSPTTLLLPKMSDVLAQNTVGQQTRIKVDATAAQFPTTVTTPDGTLIDGGALDVINVPDAEMAYTPDGTGWNKG